MVYRLLAYFIHNYKILINVKFTKNKKPLFKNIVYIIY